MGGSIGTFGLDRDVILTPAQQNEFARYSSGYQDVLPSDQSPTHPALQPYIAAVKKTKQDGHRAKRGAFNPLLPFPERVTTQQTSSQPDPYREAASLADFMDALVLPDDPLLGSTIYVMGHPPKFFQSVHEFETWLKDNGGSVRRFVAYGGHVNIKKFVQANLWFFREVAGMGWAPRDVFDYWDGREAYAVLGDNGEPVQEIIPGCTVAFADAMPEDYSNSLLSGDDSSDEEW